MRKIILTLYYDVGWECLIYIYDYTYVPTHLNTYIYATLYIFSSIHAYIHTYIYTYIHTHTHVYTYILHGHIWHRNKLSRCQLKSLVSCSNDEHQTSLKWDRCSHPVAPECRVSNTLRLKHFRMNVLRASSVTALHSR
jgi:hypothetical protein